MATPATSSASAAGPSPSAGPAFAARGFRHYRRFQSQLRAAGQAVFGLLALWLAVLIRAQLPGLSGPMNLPTVTVCLTILCAAIIAGAIAWRVRPSSRASQAATLVPTSTVAVLIALFFFRSYGTAVSRPTILFFALLATAMFVGWEALGRHWLPHAALVRNLVLIGGEGASAGGNFAQELDTGPWRVAAWFEKYAVAGPGSDATLERLQQFVRREPIDEILIADSLWEAGPEARAFFRGVGDLCEQTGVRLHVYAQWLSGCRRVHMDYLGDCPIMTFSFSVASPWLLAVKRAVDVGMSAFLLLVSSPLLAVIAVAVVLDSPGPALFSQVRCGLRGRPFRIYKFRSMAADAEARKAELATANEMSGPVFKLARDPRVTRVGRWLRKTSLDELPQLWNVLRGEMSLVGPRPPLPEEVEAYHLESLHRLAMKPGMTGMWQVSGRSAIRDFSTWVELDAQYIRRWSLWLDGKILFRTIGVLVRMNGQ